MTAPLHTGHESSSSAMNPAVFRPHSVVSICVPLWRACTRFCKSSSAFTFAYSDTECIVLSGPTRPFRTHIKVVRVITLIDDDSVLHGLSAMKPRQIKAHYWVALGRAAFIEFLPSSLGRIQPVGLLF